jgi:putative tryptophan/tyrosine transport system substrate-binding protein
MGLLGAAAAWPFTAHARTPVRYIGIMIPGAESDPDGRAISLEFERGLAERGWTSGQNVRIEYRWGCNSPESDKAAIAEFQGLSPDVIVASTSHSVAALLQATPRTPVVFTMIYEPVAQGFVQSLAHPGGNATGFTGVEATIGAKWLELLSEIAPGLARVAYLCNPDNSGPLQPFATVAAAARKHAIAVTLAGVRGANDIEAAMTALALEPGAGLIVPADGFMVKYGKLIVELAARDRLPAIYGLASFADLGGLASYGVKIAKQAREAAVYVDRILRGEKPADLPVQQPTKYELTINLKASRTLGLAISPAILARADEVLE